MKPSRCSPVFIMWVYLTFILALGGLLVYAIGNAPPPRSKFVLFIIFAGLGAGTAFRVFKYGTMGTSFGHDFGGLPAKIIGLSGILIALLSVFCLTRTALGK